MCIRGNRNLRAMALSGVSLYPASSGVNGKYGRITARLGNYIVKL